MWRLLFPTVALVTIASLLFSAGPPLRITRSGTNVLISWQQTGTNYVLEETSSLDATDTWRANTVTPLLAGGEYTVQEPIGPGMKFYRLRFESTQVDAVYVSPLGDDAAAGSADAPVFSLSRAIELARASTPPKPVYAGRGTYGLTVPLPLVSG